MKQIKKNSFPLHYNSELDDTKTFNLCKLLTSCRFSHPDDVKSQKLHFYDDILLWPQFPSKMLRFLRLRGQLFWILKLLFLLVQMHKVKVFQIKNSWNYRHLKLCSYVFHKTCINIVGALKKWLFLTFLKNAKNSSNWFITVMVGPNWVLY